jgi:hypothetical protein
MATPENTKLTREALLAEVPQMLASLEVLLPLAKDRLHELSGLPVSIKNATEVESWIVAVCLAEDVLGRVNPAGHSMVRYLLRLEAIISPRRVQQ